MTLSYGGAPDPSTRAPSSHSQGPLVGLQLRCVRVFKHFAWLEVDSVKVALSRPGRAPGWYPIPPTSTPTGHTHRVLRKREPLGGA